MKYHDDKELENSWVVANSSMNRKRQLLGINSYEKDLNFNLWNSIEAKCKRQSVKWLDVCCGEAKALIQAAKISTEHDMGIKITGIDLVGMWAPHTPLQSLKLITDSIHSWKSSEKYDFISCVHGLHYLGDKLGVLEKCNDMLTDTGMFIGHLDLDNIKSSNGKSMKKSILKTLESSGSSFDIKRRIIRFSKLPELNFNSSYIGSDDDAGPNFTGQDVVDSYYKIL